jgi:hypothetical protein
MIEAWQVVSPSQSISGVIGYNPLVAFCDRRKGEVLFCFAPDTIRNWTNYNGNEISFKKIVALTYFGTRLENSNKELLNFFAEVPV